MSQTPHKCPCCDGWGVREVWTTISTTPERRSCQSCGGTGVVWAPQAPAQLDWRWPTPTESGNVTVTSGQTTAWYGSAGATSEID